MVGSSKITTEGLPINAIPELTFLLLPPLKFCTNLSLNSSNLNTWINSVIVFSIDPFSRPLRPAINLNVSLTVRYSGNISNCGQKPKFLRAWYFSVLMLYPFIKAFPLVGFISPVNILNVVVLPAPLRPNRL